MCQALVFYDSVQGNSSDFALKFCLENMNTNTLQICSYIFQIPSAKKNMLKAVSVKKMRGFKYVQVCEFVYDMPVVKFNETVAPRFNWQ